MNGGRALIWDLPVRVFHWLFAGGFIAAAVIALLLGEDSPLFPFHAIIGLVLVFLVVFRVIWGFIGSRYARFSALAHSPRSLATYVGSALIGKARRYVGANPGSAYAALAMMLIVIGLGITGFMLGKGNESVKDLHEILAYSMLVVVGAHLLGIIMHTVRHRENIASSMVHGFQNADASVGIGSPRRFAGAALIVLTIAWAGMLLAQYDSTTQSTRIPLIAGTLQLGEAEGDEDHRANEGVRKRDRDHDEDDDD
jgi:cytochrome b